MAMPNCHENGLDGAKRGVKRPRDTSGPVHGVGNGVASPSSGQTNGNFNDHDFDDVEVPLSKRINRLNIEKEFPDGSSSQPQPQPQHLPQEESQVNFAKAYPYSPQSPYFKSNEMLRDLHFQRENRRSRLSGTSSYPPS